MGPLGRIFHIGRTPNYAPADGRDAGSDTPAAERTPATPPPEPAPRLAGADDFKKLVGDTRPVRVVPRSELPTSQPDRATQASSTERSRHSEEIKDEAEQLVADIRIAIDPNNLKLTPLSKEQEEGLFAYYTGRKELPQSEGHRARLVRRITLYQQVLLKKHLQECAAWTKDTPEGREYSKKIREFQKRQAALIAKHKPEGAKRVEEKNLPDAYHAELAQLDREIFGPISTEHTELIPMGLSPEAAAQRLRNQALYSEQAANIQAQLEKAGEEFDGGDISKLKYRKRLSDLTEQLEALQRRLYAAPMKGLEIVHGLSYRASKSDTPDVPAPSPLLGAILDQDQNLLVDARRAFMLALDTGAGSEDTPEGKLCRIFGLMLEQGHRLHTEVKNVRSLNQIDNASEAMLMYGMLRPEIRKTPSGKGYVTFAVNTEALLTDAKHFLVLERASRLKEAFAAATGDERARLDDQIRALEDDVQKAEASLKDRSEKLGVEGARTIFEAVGNRLRINASTLPVFDEPQTADTAKGTAVGKRSLDVALRMLIARIPEDERTYDPSEFMPRLTKIQNALQLLGDQAHTLAQHCKMLDGGLGDPATLDIAHTIHAQIEIAIKAVATQGSEARRSLTQAQGKTAENIDYKEQHLNPLITKADALLVELKALRQNLGKAIYADGASLDSTGAGDESAEMIAALTTVTEAQDEFIAALESKLREGASTADILQAIEQSK